MNTKWKPQLCCLISPYTKCPNSEVAICYPCLEKTDYSTDWVSGKEAIPVAEFGRVLKCPTCPTLHKWGSTNGLL